MNRNFQFRDFWSNKLKSGFFYVRTEISELRNSTYKILFLTDELAWILLLWVAFFAVLKYVPGPLSQQWSSTFILKHTHGHHRALSTKRYVSLSTNIFILIIY